MHFFERKHPSTLPSFLLRIGIAFSFLYAATSAFLMPTSWVGYFPVWMRAALGDDLMYIGLHTYSVAEVILALLLISGKHVRIAAYIAAALLLSIVVVNLGALDLVFRDVAIMFAALALAALHREDPL